MHKKAILLLAPLLAVQAYAQVSDKEVYATVNGEEIKTAFIDHIVTGSNVPPEQLDLLLERVMSAIVVAQEAEKQGLAEDPELMLELEVQRIQLLSRTYVRKLIEENEFTDEQIQARHDEVTAEMADKLEYKARHILVATEDEAKALMEEIDGDAEKFAESARTKSLDPGSGVQGGDLGWAPAQTYVPEFAATLEGMSNGDFSDPVETQFGWHILYLEDSRPLEVPELGEQQKQQILESLRNELVSDEYDRLTEAAEIVLNDE